MINPTYFVYIAECADGSYYTGYASNLNDREDVHNGLKKGIGSKYTRSRRPVKIVHSEEFDNKTDALKREVEIKKLNHEKKMSLVSSL